MLSILIVIKGWKSILKELISIFVQQIYDRNFFAFSVNKALSHICLHQIVWDCSNIQPIHYTLLLPRHICTVSITDLDKLNFVKLDYGGLVLGYGQFLLLPQLPQKITLVSKSSKWLKNIIFVCWAKCLTHCQSRCFRPGFAEIPCQTNEALTASYYSCNFARLPELFI